MMQSSSHLRRRVRKRKVDSDASSNSSSDADTSDASSPASPRFDDNVPVQGQAPEPSHLPSPGGQEQGREFDARVLDRYEIENPFVRVRPKRSGTQSTYTYPNTGRGSVYQNSVHSRSPNHASTTPDNNEQALDIPLAVVIIPPLGTLLIGGDFFKDFLLLLLMFFYLHQLIKVPWELYLASRPRLSDSPSHTNLPPELHDVYTLAESELKAAELIYLALSVLSPLIGAVLLRYVCTALAGRDYISWFSTGLFVLVTGIRPWGHLTRRLRERTETLQGTIEQARDYIDSTKGGEDSLFNRVADLEDFVAKSREAMEESNNEVDASLGVIDATLDKLVSDVEHQFRMLNERVGLLESTLMEAQVDRKSVGSAKVDKPMIGSKWFPSPVALARKFEYDGHDLTTRGPDNMNLIPTATSTRHRPLRARERARSKSSTSLPPVPEDPLARPPYLQNFTILSCLQSWIGFVMDFFLKRVVYFFRIGRELVWNFALFLRRSFV